VTASATRAGAHEEVVPPAPKSQPAPEWPEGKAETHDVVVPLVVTVNADGTVAGVEIETSVSPAFDAAALRAAARWTFEPATRKGVPIKAKIRAAARFSSEPAPAPPKASAPPREPKPAPEPASPARMTKPSPLTVNVTGEGPPRSASEVVRKRDVIAAAPHRTASDLLKLVPGVFITQHGGQGKAHQIFLRGFDAVHGQDLEIWVAGAPVNEVSNVHGQGYADLHFVMPEVVRQLRAKPGSYDPRQGDFAVAGSVGFDLGLAEPGITGSLTLGSFGERRIFVAYHPANTPDATFAAFEAQSTDGFGPSRASRRTSAIGQATYSFGGFATARIMASTYAARYDSAGVLRLADIERGAVDRFSTYDPRQGGDSSRSQVVIEIGDEDEAARARWSIAPYFVARALRLRANYTGFLEDPISGDSQQQKNEALTVGLTGHYRRSLRIFSTEDAIEGGVFARNDWIEQSQRRLSVVDDRTTQTLVDAKVRATDAGGYIDVSLRPVRRVVVRGGVRVDGLAYATEELTGEGAGAARAALGAHIGGKATVDVSILPGLHAVASYGDGFRSPQARSLGDGERTPFTTVRSFEGGVRYASDERVGASLAVFHTRLSDDLVFEETTARNERAPSTQRTGFALDFTLRPRSWLLHSGSVTYTRASFTASDEFQEDGSLVPYAPQLVARTDLALTPRLARLFNRDLRGRLGAGLTFLAVRPLPFAELGHEIFLADLTAGLRLKEVELEVDVYNLLDAEWYDGEFTYASNFTKGAAPALVPLRHVTVGAPFTVTATLSIHL